LTQAHQQDKPARLLDAMPDVAARRLAEGRLPGANQLLRQLLEVSTDVICLYRVSPELRVEYVSLSVESLTGYAPSDFYCDANLYINEVVHPDDQDHELQHMSGKTGSPDSIVRWRHRDGSVAFMEIRRFPVHDGDGNVLIAGIARDVTERARAEEEARRAHQEVEEANRAKSQLLSRMSHELRTPLNSIIGFAELLEMDDLTDDQRESVAYIVKGGRHLLRLINEVLDISRIEAGHLRLALEPVQLNDVLSDALDMCRPQAAQRGIEVEECPPPDCDHLVLADRHRLTEVFLNLLINAIKYNRPGGRVEVSSEPVANRRVRVAVRDTGPGIPLEKLSRLFTPFDRLDAESTGVEGTGLGLALAKSVVESMGGAVGATSDPGNGSTFWVELPLADPLVDVKRGQPAAFASSNGLGRQSTCRVLCVEEDPASAELMGRVCRQRPGVELLLCRTGAAAMAALARGLPDLILLDLGLPDMHGEQLLHHIRNLPGGAAVRVVVKSADATPATAKRLLDAGADDYMTKPVRVQCLLDLLDNVSSRGPRSGAAQGVAGEAAD
jgi:PAS domain S-box-containing protein